MTTLSTYQVIHSDTRGIIVGLLSEQPFRQCGVESIICTWTGKATNKAHASRLGQESFVRRGLKQTVTA